MSTRDSNPAGGYGLAEINALLEVIGRAQDHYIREDDPRQLYDDLLGDLLKLTCSKYGFIGDVLYTEQGQPYLKTQTITDVASHDETRAFYEASIPRGLELYNLNTLFGAVMASGEAVIANDPRHDPRSGGLPEGHPPLNAFLGVPVYAGEHMRGMIGLANRPGGYDQALVEFLQPLLKTYGRIIESIYTSRQTQQALQKSHSYADLLANYIRRAFGHSIEDITRSTLGFLRKELGIYHGFLALITPDGREFRIYDIGQANGTGISAPNTIPIGQSVLAELIDQQTPRYRPDIASEPDRHEMDAKLLAAGIRCDYLVPLWKEDIFLGTLNVASEKIDGFSKDLRDFIPLLAPSLAQSIQNALLYNSLHEEETRYRNLVDGIHDIIQVVSADGHFAFVNRAWRALLGYGAAELEQLKIWDIVDTACLESCQQLFGDLFAGKERAEFQTCFRSKNGTPIQMEAKVTTQWEGGQVVAIHCILRDITERAQREQTIKEQLHHLEVIARISRISLRAGTIDELLQNVLDEMLDIFQCDRAWLLYPCNPEAPTWSVPMERTRPEWPGAGVRNMDIPMAPDVAELFHTALVERGIQIFGPNGKEVNAASRQFSVQSGMVIGIFPKVDQDWLLGIHHCAQAHAYTESEQQIFAELGQRITEAMDSLLAYRNLQQSESRFRTLVDQSPLGIQVLSPGGQTLKVNRAWEALWGLSLDQLRDYNILEDRQLVDKGVMPLIQRAFQGETVEVPPINYNPAANDKVKGPHSDRWVRAFIYPVKNERGDIQEIILLHEDVTQSRQSLEKLRQAAVVVENTAEGIIITDENNRIISINKAFTEITGYSPEEALGRNPNILRSDRHDKLFYKALWTSVLNTGSWQGELWDRHKNGELFPIWSTISAVKDDDGRLINYVSVFSDISSIKQSQEQLNYLAHHDPLTHLPNRILFNDRLEHAMQRAQREERQMAVLFLDLDRFKTINDSLGHPVGDLLLKLVADRIRKTMREEDTVARLGGDEFIMLLEDVRDTQDIALLAQKLIQEFNTPFIVHERELHLGISMGISLFPRDGTDSATLIKNADAAMYRAKEEGRNDYQFYTTSLTTAVFERLTLESALRSALQNREFVLYYQPQYTLANRQMVGAEALIRWRHPGMGLVAPDKFITIAEESGLIVPIGEWVLRTACSQLQEWRRAGLNLNRIAVNVSARQFYRGEIVRVVKTVLDETGLPANSLELEITESIIMQESGRAITTLHDLSLLGVTIAIDDFGTGYSSLSYLKQLPVHKLKVDRSFVRDIPHDVNDEAITRAIIALGQNLQLVVLAEGVESVEQQDFLTILKCDEVQGFLYSRPLPAEQFSAAFGRDVRG
ncbi:MAG: hypothetical protein A2V90_08635 [Gammaproteobacteria bacterium RBG_16_57_12]|nr:MAG: hypothetical protein A2V90_08635 [Gammaproteobacteria bacterium RBG_16_57_12]